MTRDTIIEKIHKILEPLPYIHALWLEGADANVTVDEYSDIDFWIDAEDEYEQQAFQSVEDALAQLSTIDYKYIAHHPHPKIRQRYYHLEGTSEYLMIDLCLQLHSREAVIFIEGNTIETVKVLFDKCGVIKHKPLDMADYTEPNNHRLESIKHDRTQYSRVKRFIKRGRYLEAYMQYNAYVLAPLVDLLRLIHTPANADYGLCHISRHIPNAQREKLEYFAQVSSLEEIEAKMEQAGKWFDELLQTK